MLCSCENWRIFINQVLMITLQESELIDMIPYVLKKY